MRNLKNWTITAKAIKHSEKGLINYINYLNDNERHKGQTLTKISDNEALKAILTDNHNFELQRKLEEKRHKGGRPSNIGWSAVFSYPFDIESEEFILLKNKIAYNFYKYINDVEKLNMSEEEIEKMAKNVIGVVHNGDNINNHMHLIFNKIFIKTEKNIIKKNTKKLVSIDLTKKKYLYNLKKINDNVVEEILNINKADYIIETKLKPQKRRRTKIEIKLDKLNKRENELNKRENELNEKEAIYIELSKKYTKIAIKHKEKVKELDEKENELNKEKVRLIKYTEQQFKKDLELHTKYMAKGMTEKAKKLEEKIEYKINKTNNTINKLK